jgi:exopolysaccharide/PEP-CTERM locus tyrosine autokinase
VRKRQAPPSPSKYRIDSDLISLIAPRSLEAELFRALRSKILFPLDGRLCRSIMVTSATSGEGKSFVAANLAVNMAANVDQHVLLMDCDLRAPCVHRKFGFRNVKGLSNYLANGLSLQSLLLKTGINKLTLLPAGTPPDNPAEILSSAKMEQLLDEVMERYEDRTIIIDAPPPLVVPDTSAIAKKVDGILLVVQHAKTDYALLEELIAEVGQEKIIGAVINQCNMRSSHKYGYSRYTKYGKYGRKK